MSRHVPRSERWSSQGTTAHRSVEGPLVRLFKGDWWATIAYELFVEPQEPDQLAAWEPHSDRLGPYRRPRNAMVEAERHVAALRNRHGERLRLLDAQESA